MPKSKPCAQILICWNFTVRLPTDLAILKHIYRTHLPDYLNGEEKRYTKVYVPVDVHKVAAHFRCEGDLIFGRLYYYINQKYRYKNEADGTVVELFMKKFGQDFHVIQFPLLSSIIASMKSDEYRHSISFGVSVLALLVAIISAAITAGAWLLPQSNTSNQSIQSDRTNVWDRASTPPNS